MLERDVPQGQYDSVYESFIAPFKDRLEQVKKLVKYVLDKLSLHLGCEMIIEIVLVNHQVKIVSHTGVNVLLCIDVEIRRDRVHAT